MNYLFKSLIVLSYVYASISIASTDIITQGGVTVSFSDIDGFSYTIPETDRPGFFEDPSRIDKTITSILTMKLVNNYAKEKNLIDMEKINSTVEETMKKQVSFDPSHNNFMELEKQYNLLKNYFIIKATYNYFLEYFNKQTKAEDLSDLAEEYYILNQDIFVQSEMRDIDFLSLDYNSKNKEENRKIITELLNKMQARNFSEIADSYTDKDSAIKLSYIKNYTSNTKQKKFSKIAFQKQSVGLINKVIDLDSKFLIVNINNIEKEKQKTFEEVKAKIIKKLKDEKNARDFNHFLLTLTKDKVDLNKENFISLRTRYNKK